jgi:hypothetical protein
MRIRYVYAGSNIPDSGSGSASKNLGILIQKIVSKLSEYDPECSSRIRIQIILHHGSGSRGKKVPDPGSRIPIRYTAYPESLPGLHYYKDRLPLHLSPSCRSTRCCSDMRRFNAIYHRSFLLCLLAKWFPPETHT